MRIQRQETFQGLRWTFPEEIRSPVDELIRRVEYEFDYIIDRLRTPWTVTRDSESVVADVGGERLTITHPDGSQEPVEIDFGQDQEFLT